MILRNNPKTHTHLGTGIISIARDAEIFSHSIWLPKDDTRLYDSDEISFVYNTCINLKKLKSDINVYSMAHRFLGCAASLNPEKLKTFLNNSDLSTSTRFDDLNNTVLHYLSLTGKFKELKLFLKKHQPENEEQHKYFKCQLEKCNSKGVSVVDFAMLSGSPQAINFMHHMLDNKFELNERYMKFIRRSGSEELMARASRFTSHPSSSTRSLEDTNARNPNGFFPPGSLKIETPTPPPLYTKEELEHQNRITDEMIDVLGLDMPSPVPRNTTL